MSKSEIEAMVAKSVADGVLGELLKRMNLAIIEQVDLIRHTVDECASIAEHMEKDCGCGKKIAAVIRARFGGKQ